MKLICDRTSLIEALSSVLPAIPSKEPAKPALRNVRMVAQDEQLTLMGTNLELAISSRLDSVKIEKPGEVQVPARPFHALLNEIADPTIELVAEDGSLVLPTGSGEYHIVTSEADFPELRLAAEGEGVPVPVEVLALLYQRTEFACAKEASRYAMNGLLVRVKDGRITFVGTDGRRLAVSSESLEGVPAEVVAEALVPQAWLGSSIRSLGAFGDGKAELFFGENNLSLAGGRTWISIQRVHGAFPDFESVIPRDQANKVDLSRVLLENAIRRVSVFCEELNPAVRLSFEGGRLELSTESAEVGSGKATVDIVLKGAGGLITFNPKYVLDALKACQEEEIRFEFEDSNSPGKFVLGEQYLYVVMPITGQA